MKKATLALCSTLALSFFSIQAFAQDALTIGFTISRTGKLNNDATAQLRGIELWRDEINAKGGIKAGSKSYKINRVSY